MGCRYIFGGVKWCVDVYLNDKTLSVVENAYIRPHEVKMWRGSVLRRAVGTVFCAVQRFKRVRDKCCG